MDLAGVRGSRTHPRHRRAPRNSFEDCEDHRAPSTPVWPFIVADESAEEQGARGKGPGSRGAERGHRGIVLPFSPFRLLPFSPFRPPAGSYAHCLIRALRRCTYLSAAIAAIAPSAVA